MKHDVDWFISVSQNVFGVGNLLNYIEFAACTGENDMIYRIFVSNLGQNFVGYRVFIRE